MESNVGKETKKKKMSARLSKGVLIAFCCILLVVVILAAALVGTFFALKTAGKASLLNKKNQSSIDTSYEYDPNSVFYDGKKYRLNNELTTFLFIGVDTGKEEYVVEEHIKDYFIKEAERTGRPFEEIYNEWYEREIGSDTPIDDPIEIPGQADVLLLVVLDEEKQHVSIISIDRNSMSFYETFDKDGNNMGASEAQLALTYSYGDGEHQSCNMTADAVSNFLYETPIHAYCSMNLMAIRDLTDAIGGVEVTIPVDMTETNEDFVEGSRILLDGKKALNFLIPRISVGDGSNTARLERHKQFIFSFIDCAVAAIKKDWGLPIELYNKISENCCTNLEVSEIVYLANLVPNIDISYHSIEGTTDTSGFHAEFRPDADALWQLILDIFYICEE